MAPVPLYRAVIQARDEKNRVLAMLTLRSSEDRLDIESYIERAGTDKHADRMRAFLRDLYPDATIVVMSTTD